MKIDEKVNKENVKLFERYGINNNDNIYTCVCCGRKTCLDNSGSIKGAYLVCGECAWDKFDGWSDCREWQREMLGKGEENEKK